MLPVCRRRNSWSKPQCSKTIFSITFTFEYHSHRPDSQNLFSRGPKYSSLGWVVGDWFCFAILKSGVFRFFPHVYTSSPGSSLNAGKTVVTLPAICCGAFPQAHVPRWNVPNLKEPGSSPSGCMHSTQNPKPPWGG